jgi:hypothetical protein
MRPSNRETLRKRLPPLNTGWCQKSEDWTSAISSASTTPSSECYRLQRSATDPTLSSSSSDARTGTISLDRSSFLEEARQGVRSVLSSIRSRFSSCFSEKDDGPTNLISLLRENPMFPVYSASGSSISSLEDGQAGNTVLMPKNPAGSPLSQANTLIGSDYAKPQIPYEYEDYSSKSCVISTTDFSDELTWCFRSRRTQAQK